MLCCCYFNLFIGVFKGVSCLLVGRTWMMFLFSRLVGLFEYIVFKNMIIEYE